MREKYRVKIARQAETDLAEIWTYVAADSVDNANQFILKLERRMKTLENSPRRCPLISENELLGTQYRHLVVKKYRTYFESRMIRSTFSGSFTGEDCWILP